MLINILAYATSWPAGFVQTDNFSYKNWQQNIELQLLQYYLFEKSPGDQLVALAKQLL